MFVDGKALLRGIDLEELELKRFINVIAQLFVEEGSDEHAEHRDKARAVVVSKLMSYNKTKSYGRSNDNLGRTQAPLPYIPPTEQTEAGYVGLDPPLG